MLTLCILVLIGWLFTIFIIDNIIQQNRIENRKKICELLKEGNNIALVCITTKEKPELKLQADKWTKKAINILDFINSSYPIRFNRTIGKPTLHNNNVPEINNMVWNDIILKCEILNEFLKELQ